MELYLVTNAFAILSGLSLAVAVIFDKLFMSGDCYKGSATTPFFVSTVFGSVLGLVGTGLGWVLFYDPFVTFDDSIALLAQMPLEVGCIALAGSLCGNVLRNYFICFNHINPTVIALCLAIIPVFVFFSTVFIDGSTITWSHGISIFCAVSGLVFLEFFSPASEDNSERQQSIRKYVSLVLLNGLSVGYILLLYYTNRRIALTADIAPIYATSLSLPYFWIGVCCAGITALRQADVRRYLDSIPQIPRYISIIIALEVIGASVYQFEAFGLAESDATLVQLIIGSNVIIIWFFDRYLGSRGKDKTATGYITVFGIQVALDQIEERPSLPMLMLQICAIVLSLGGVLMFPY